MRVQPLNAASEDLAVAKHSDLSNALSLDSLNFFLADVRDASALTWPFICWPCTNGTRPASAW